MVHCLEKRKKCGEHRPKEYDDTYASMVRTITTQLIGNVRELVENWSWDEISVEENRLSGERRRDTVIGMSRFATSVWTLKSLERTFISLEERWFRMYMADTLGVVYDCFIGQILDHGHVVLQEEPTKTYRTYEDVN